ncbi:MAG: hypothetical protein JWQ79_1628 [Mucilaginibacter sp.]|jgi:hypothetical protein|nr:hypothetical protein [Mucilaginibacter sp.]
MLDLIKQENLWGFQRLSCLYIRQFNSALPVLVSYLMIF